MSRMLFVNLAVTDLTKSIDFFTQLGFRFNPQFTDEKAACMELSDSSFVMLLTRDFFATFATAPIVDSKVGREAILAVSAAGRDEVDSLCDRALELGASPAQWAIDEGFMYGRSFHDPDGHHWEVLYMDPSAVEPQ